MNSVVQTELDLPPQTAAASQATALSSLPAVERAVPEAAELWVAVQLKCADPALLATLLRHASRFTPRVTVEPADALLLELRGSQRLFGGLRALLQSLREAFPLPLRLAMAPTPLAALVLARAGFNGCITSPARLLGRVAPLPLSLLRWPGDVLERLRGMGVDCLGDLLRLPRAGLARRIGPDHLRQLDRLVGRCADPRAAVVPGERFAERIDPDAETIDRERLLAALAPALDRLECFLRARQRGITALRLVLGHRTGAPTACVLRCVVAEYRAARFAALLAAKLEALVLAQPVNRLELTAGRLRRFAAASGGLWQPGEQGGLTQAGLPDFLQTLIARLGERAVYGIEPVAGHRPERQWRSVPPARSLEGSRSPSSRQGPAEWPGSRSPRPLGLLPQPMPLDVDREAGRVQGLQYAGGALHLVSGPERIESGWWDGGDIARDYYVARADHGALLWIFRERHAPRRWYLHGCFA